MLITPARHVAFWAGFVATQSADPTPRLYEAFHFDDNEADANALAELVLAGRKRATASLLCVFQHRGKPIPQPGHISIVTNYAGDALCVIETDRTDILPFDEVTEEFATVEGEGDRSLEHWRHVHLAFFGREAKRIGRSFEPGMLVICERFTVVHRGAPSIIL